MASIDPAAISAAGDARLLQECLNGSEEAWAALIDKYKRLIYSIPLKYHASQEDAADIFQAVCLELFSELPRLRKTESLRFWLITVTTRQCVHWKHKRQANGTGLEDKAGEVAGAAAPPEIYEEVEQEQMLREAVARLPERCRRLIHMLFYETPALPYSTVAQRLGLATGSIGFIRGRCLKRLHQLLEEMGF